MIRPSRSSAASARSGTAACIGPEQGMERVALAGLDSLREVDLFLVREHPPARGLRSRRRGNGCRSGVVRRGCVGERVELERC